MLLTLAHVHTQQKLKDTVHVHVCSPTSHEQTSCKHMHSMPINNVQASE